MTGYEVEFLAINVLAAAGILAGTIVGRLGGRPEKPPAAASFDDSGLAKYAALAVVCLTATFAYIFYSVGFDVSNLFTQYGFERSVITSTSLVDSLAFPCSVAGLLYARMATSGAQRAGRWSRRTVLICCLLAALLFLVRGDRNLSFTLWLPIIAMKLRGRPIPLLKATAIASAAFMLYSVIAIVRSVGFANAGDVPLTFENLDPNRGEIGTTYNVFSIYQWMAADDEPQYGKTYTVDFLINLVPSVVWPDRPKSTAVRFSGRFYGAENPEDGLGFSPVVEAMANFGVVGVLPLFAIFAATVPLVADWLRRKGRWGELSWFMLLPMLLNTNRIDSNAAGKMLLVYIAFFFLYDFAFQARARRHPSVGIRVAAAQSPQLQ